MSVAFGCVCDDFFGALVGFGASPLLVLHKVTVILDCFSVDEPDPTLQQIIRKAGLPSSTCQRLVRNMFREGSGTATATGTG
ncbi:helix-turn-helix domain-containing protein [Paenarthrobacter aurescens]|uniref:helix-turn-helix domain-containing protein n=1 Tax=Paenarthrobacter aurescens TaxID=43663 RepID=UPI0021C0297F|nr:helix-turn-helix domain-containing protein [Paenarthrobacter aurescens]MCT9868348.1 helix-turn-helix domain-containing protein [Paenarthrobacter aurescens]